MQIYFFEAPTIRPAGRIANTKGAARSRLTVVMIVLIHGGGREE
jgi:hypothetical protein